MKKIIAIITFNLMLSFPAISESLVVGIGLSKPPYVIQSENRGIEYDIVKRALELSGYSMTARYLPLKRIAVELEHGAIDAGLNMRSNLDMDIYLSDPIIAYHNFAISLEKSELKIETFKDLENKSIIAFQNANKLLGKNFSKVIKNNKNYSETPHQHIQVKMLTFGRAEVVISDYRIFDHFLSEHEEVTGQNYEIKYHNIFPPTDYSVGFKSIDIRNSFNEALTKMKKSGEYNKIISQYSKKDLVKRNVN